MKKNRCGKYVFEGTYLMGKKSTSAKTAPKPRPVSDIKGRLVEQIAAQMHQSPGVTVEKRVKMPAIGSSGETSEIDVLLTSEVAGYPVRLAIECKNEKDPIGTPKINTFIGKLDDVGIPRQHGIFISASGYTSGAVVRAKKEGIRTLTLQGLTKDALASEVTEAFQSVVYLLPHVVNWGLQTPAPPTNDPSDLAVFYNVEGKRYALVPDLIWRHWLAGGLPAAIGEHDCEIAIPSGWHQVIDGRTVVPQSLTARVHIVGLVLTLKGRATQHSLVNATDQTVEKHQVNVEFDPASSSPTVTTILTEQQLKDFHRQSQGVTVQIGRLPLPRIRFLASYWPPSARVATMLMEKMRAFEAGKIPDPRPFTFEEIEGTDMKAIWEPIWDKHPAGAKPADSQEDQATEPTKTAAHHGNPSA